MKNYVIKGSSQCHNCEFGAQEYVCTKPGCLVELCAYCAEVHDCELPRKLWQAKKGTACGGFETEVALSGDEFVRVFAPILRRHCTLAYGLLREVKKSLESSGWVVTEVTYDVEDPQRKLL